MVLLDQKIVVEDPDCRVDSESVPASDGFPRVLYPGMAKTAREEGFEEISDWFETLAKAEKSRAGRFVKMLASIR